MNSCLNPPDYLQDEVAIKHEGALFDGGMDPDGSLHAIMEKASTSRFSDDESDGEDLDLDNLINSDAAQFARRDRELGDIMEMMRKTSIDETMVTNLDEAMDQLDSMPQMSMSIDSLMGENRKYSSGDSLTKGSIEFLMDGMRKSSLDEVVDMLAIDNGLRPSFEIALDAVGSPRGPGSSSSSTADKKKLAQAAHWRSRSESDVGKMSLNDAIQMNQIFEAAYLEPDDGKKKEGRTSTASEASRSGSDMSSRSSEAGGGRPTGGRPKGGTMRRPAQKLKTKISMHGKLKRGRTSSMEACASLQRSEKKISTISGKQGRPNSMFEATGDPLRNQPSLERSISAPLMRPGRPGDPCGMPPGMPMPFGMPWMPMPGMPMPKDCKDVMPRMPMMPMPNKDGTMPMMPMPMPGMPLPPNMKLENMKNMPIPMMPMPNMNMKNMKNMPNMPTILPMPGMPMHNMPMPQAGDADGDQEAGGDKKPIIFNSAGDFKGKKTLPKPPYPMMPMMLGPRGFMLPMSMGMPMMPLPFLSRMNNKSNGEVFVKARGGYKCGRCGQQKAGHDCPYKSKKGEKTEEDLRRAREEEEMRREEREDSKVVYGRCMAVQCDLDITA
jgi:hypothetical protein